MASTRITTTLGVLVNRMLIPAWLLTGAIFKLYFRDPQSLPESIWKLAHELGMNLDVLLRGIIGIEFVIAGIMIFSARFARPVAIALMSLFCLILLWELRVGAASCGCLGKITMPPWLMLLIDVPLLIAAIAFKPPRPQPRAARESDTGPRPWPVIVALAVLIVSFGTAFGVPDDQVPVDGGDGAAVQVVQRDDQPGEPTSSDERSPSAAAQDRADDDEGARAGDDQSSAPPKPRPKPQRNVQPPSYYVLEPPKWIGQRWDDLQIALYVKGTPSDINSGRHYVLFYNPTCDHCFDVLDAHFTGELPAPTTVIAIPEYKTHFETQGVYPMPCNACERLELKLGCNWITSPPVLVALEDGVVKCAEEVQDVANPDCLLWH